MVVKAKTWPVMAVVVAMGLSLLGATGARATQAGTPRPTAGESAPFLVVSDMHFNPLDDTSLAARLDAAPAKDWPAILDGTAGRRLSPFGRDSNWFVLRSAMAAMRHAQPHPAYILHTGDMLAHDFRDTFEAALPAHKGDEAAYRVFALKTVTTLLETLRHTFPSVPILTALGNNDSYCGDYAVEPSGQFLGDTLPLLTQGFGRTLNSRADQAGIGRDWRQAGNYVMPHPTLKGVRILSFDTVMLTRKYKNNCGRADDTPQDTTLAWLHQALADARAAGDSVWLITHVVPGIDGFATANNWSKAAKAAAAAGQPIPACTAPVELFAPGMEARFEAELAQYHDIIKVLFAGHIHMDDLRLVGPPGAGVPVLVTPAVSPVYQQSPSFKLGQAAPDGTIAHLTTYYLTNLSDQPSVASAHWVPEYDTAQAWGARPLSPDALRGIIAHIRDSAPARALYRSIYSVARPQASAMIPDNQALYLCALDNTLAEAYTRCACPAP
ncbi:calcineurin-like phosphoesterase family protein [Nitrospirillum bahiense]|uniref:Calcineurin-like phosphoesterase family protein n=1 Tax=Nitrospirillum amazonense TaxID=28077 RepID=A0A560G1Q0_9PROT|nr:calcineurin-like phosphoesterase family protein [Nitrospirillum amazonense]